MHIKVNKKSNKLLKNNVTLTVLSLRSNDLAHATARARLEHVPINRVLRELAGQHQTDGGLDLARGDRRLPAGQGQPRALGRDLADKDVAT